MVNERVNIPSINANYYTPLIKLDASLRSSSLTLTTQLLIYIRASQINGCAYCVQLHIKEAIEKGEKQYRIHALPAWQHSPFFTEKEQVILSMTEEITAISAKGLTDEVYEKATTLLNEEEIADVIMATTCINAWNRIGRATLLVPDKSQD
ncbi:MAG: carboxymuconolactone decarboxylase family protein [Cyclobacteriaceae bacterium]